MYRRRLCLLLLAATCALATMTAGCSSTPAQGGDPTGRWEPTKLEGTAKPVAGSYLELDGAGRVSGFSGVNTFAGPYAVEDSSITLGPLASTKMAGPPAAMVGEQAFVAALEAATSFTAEDDSLTLYDAEGAAVGSFTRGETVGLTNTTWVLTGYNNGKGAVVNTADTGNITAVFSEEGTMTGASGCGKYESTYTAQGQGITVGKPKSVKTEPCPIGLADQRAAYLAAIPKAVRWEAGVAPGAGGSMATLELRDEEGALLARVRGVFRQVAATPRLSMGYLLADSNFLEMGRAGSMADQVTFGGRYSAEHFIGVPGRLEAYSGLDSTNQQKVAVLTAAPKLDTDASAWTQRAQNVAALQNPGIAKLLDWGTENDRFFVVQQWVHGSDMGTAVSKAGPIQYDKVAAYGAQVAGALSAAHSKGIVDGDIRPEDVVLTGDGSIVLAGVGAPGMIEPWVPAPDATPTAAQYMSPEQCQGAGATKASDIYGLGAVLYYMATGKAPFDGPDAAAVCEQQKSGAVTAPSKHNPSVPAALEAVIMRALAKNPVSRYGSADEMRQALEAVSAGGQTQVMPVITVPPKKRKVWPWVVGILAALLLIGGGLAAAWWLGYIGGVTVPDLKGQTPTQAEKTLENAELVMGNVDAQPDYPSGTKLGTIFQQTPGANGKARKEAPVNIVIAGGETVQVPNVIGQSESEAINRLDNAGFQLAPVARKFDDKADSGTVIAQTPTAGTDQLKGSTVTLTVSRGPETVDVPNVLNKTEADATNELQKAGLKVQVQQQQSDQVPKGQVAQMSPAGGVKVDKGATVTIYVSTGTPQPAQVIVPNVVGQTQNDANNTLQNLDLRTSFTYVAADAANKGKVIATDPGVGSSVAVGSTVTLQIGQ